MVLAPDSAGAGQEYAPVDNLARPGNGSGSPDELQVTDT
jgi:hypothetical protein